MKHSLLRPTILAIVLTFTSIAHGQINVTFSGGGIPNPTNSPFSLTIAAPVTYTVTTATQYIQQYGGTEAPLFVINGAGTGPVGEMTGNVTFTITADGVSTSYPIDLALGDTLNPDVPDGLMLQGPANESLSVGDTVTLSAGTLTAINHSAIATPASGSYPTYLVDGYSRVLSGAGVSVAPEPSTWALLGLGAAGLVLTLRRRAARV